MSAQFMSVMRQAFKTFDRSNHGNFNTNFQQLKKLVEQLTYRDLQLNPIELFKDTIFERPGRAPCTYMHIFENELVSLSLFVMRGGYTMPLHDHPLMYGLLRGIFGQLHVQSYTQKLAPDEQITYEKDPIQIDVIADEARLVNPESECAVLTPRERNFHEITAVNGVAAFFDILSPPYDADMPGIGPRCCRFYRPKVDTISMPSLQLMRIPSPLSYYCDLAETPELVTQCTFLCMAEMNGHVKEVQ